MFCFGSMERVDIIEGDVVNWGYGKGLQFVIIIFFIRDFLLFLDVRLEGIDSYFEGKVINLVV